MDYSHCGVGFITTLKSISSHEILKKGLLGLKKVEHRGGSSSNGKFGDGAGVQTSIPHELLGIDSSYAVAVIFAPHNEELYMKSISIFEETFAQFDLHIESYREVPINVNAIGLEAQKGMPKIVQAFIKRPTHCRTMASFDELLYNAKQRVRTNEKRGQFRGEFHFTSLSSQTIVYKALCTSTQLEEFYPDLKNTEYKTMFTLFHRRFSTNTLPSWDKVQPFRMIAHNGEINTIEGNRAAAVSRELALGLKKDQILTREGASDSGNLNDIIESLKYRSSMPFLKNILSILIPPADSDDSSYFKFWSRAMEPWDGPALVVYCDGKSIGARLDRSGFRPCRWHRTDEYFSLCSETGVFDLDFSTIQNQGVLYAGRTVNIHMFKAEVDFLNPDQLEDYKEMTFDPRLSKLPYMSPKVKEDRYSKLMSSFYFTKEDLSKELNPMIVSGRGPIGSMGDTATLSALSTIHRSIYDFFFQDFAQVTNPPLDYIREKFVTSLKVYLGRKPNIFSPREMIPLQKAIELDGPVLSHGQMEYLLEEQRVELIDICFDRSKDQDKFQAAIQSCVDRAVNATNSGKSIIILSDRKTSYDRPAIPSIIVMRAVQVKLNQLGIRLKISLIVDSGEIRNSHQIAVLISFGASAICPYVALDLARYNNELKFPQIFTEDEKEQRLIKAMEEGLLKIMAKRGISVIRSYQGSELFTILGIDSDIAYRLFKKHQVTLGGVNFQNLLNDIIDRTEQTKDGSIHNNFIYKEHASGKMGEKHSITTKRTKILHELLAKDYQGIQSPEWKNFKEQIYQNPINIRDFFIFKEHPIDISKVQKTGDILTKFGSGAMSYGSISAESQRDIIIAMREIGGRSNSGEGGENPYYFKDGITAKIKQIASGRFGVTAEYLVLGDEVQIKMAQGAKPGEGGQLMGVKVDANIAKARFSNVGVNLISPPPHHDIYSIEDLKQLIYELKQLKPDMKVSVKLVAGKNIGPIALGVVKAGADIIQISGGNGGTGAANLMSMKHAGLPWEIGLMEVHQHLSDANLRSSILLRVDGGLFSGFDVVMAAIYGAEEFDFGKMLLVSQGCIMARVCEKNICPAGIATQDEKFKKRYNGRVENTVKYLKYIAEDVQYYLAQIGYKSLDDVIGHTNILDVATRHADLKKHINVNLDFFTQDLPTEKFLKFQNQPDFNTNELNQQILEDFFRDNNLVKTYTIESTDRAVPANLIGKLAMNVAKERSDIGYQDQEVHQKHKIQLTFEGSAGQAFGVFNIEGMELKLFGEANDSVAKGMSGGKVTIVPHKKSKLLGHENVLVGNTCLYGATGGEIYLNGIAGDRFCVRNSGAIAVVEGVGLHACEYMTGGQVVILGKTLKNIGSGMTGGVIYTHVDNLVHLNPDFITHISLDESDLKFLRDILERYVIETNSMTAKNILTDFDQRKSEFIKLVPVQFDND